MNDSFTSSQPGKSGGNTSNSPQHQEKNYTYQLMEAPERSPQQAGAIGLNHLNPGNHLDSSNYFQQNPLNVNPFAALWPQGNQAPPVQAKQEASPKKSAPTQKKENNTGLPDHLKSGIENLSGYAMDDVKVHYNSDKPAQLQAHAYAQGTEIHIGPGQEQHLPHEAWHVVQQKQGRVQPTRQMKGSVPVNDDIGLEREADVMGVKAVQRKKTDYQENKEQDEAKKAQSSAISQKKDNVLEDSRIQYLRDLLSIFPNLKSTEVDSKVTAWQIMQTQEYKSLINPKLVWQIDYDLSYGQAVNICRLMIKKMADGHMVNWEKEAHDFVEQGFKEPSQEETQQKPLSGEYKDLKDRFDNAIQSASTLPDLEAEIQDFGSKLWNLAKGKPDDKGIYWTRIAMRTLIRKHDLFKVRENLKQLNRVYRKLEIYSCGMRDIEFDTKDATLSRVLISGFDPYQGGKSNPSGIVAQMLDGKKITYGKEKVAIVEAVTFPVAYSDFDKGIVENFYGPLLNDPKQKIALVMTISLDPGAEHMQLDRYAAKNRAGWYDNEGVGVHNDKKPPKYSQYKPSLYYIQIAKKIYDLAKAYYPSLIGTLANPASVNDFSKLTNYYIEVEKLYNEFQNHKQKVLPQIGTATTPEFIETPVPFKEIMQDPLIPKELAVKQDYRYIDKNGIAQDAGGKGKVTNSNKAITPYNTLPKDTQALEGPGGNYLSNEIYYRVSQLTNAMGDPVPNVHLHIPDVGNTNKEGGGQFDIGDIYTKAEEIIAVTIHKIASK